MVVVMKQNITTWDMVVVVKQNITTWCNSNTYFVMAEVHDEDTCNQRTSCIPLLSERTHNQYY